MHGYHFCVFPELWLDSEEGMKIGQGESAAHFDKASVTFMFLVLRSVRPR